MPDQQDSTAELEKLAAELDHRNYATIMTGGPLATLRVVNRNAPRLAEDIHAGDGWFCGAATGLIAPCNNIPAAAQAVARAIGRQTG